MGLNNHVADWIYFGDFLGFLSPRVLAHNILKFESLVFDPPNVGLRDRLQSCLGQWQGYLIFLLHAISEMTMKTFDIIFIAMTSLPLRTTSIFSIVALHFK